MTAVIIQPMETRNNNFCLGTIIPLLLPKISNLKQTQTQGCRFPQIFQYTTTTDFTPIPNLRNMFCLVSYEHLIKASFLRKTLNYIKTLKIKIMHRWRSHQIAQRNHSLQNPSAVISCNGLSANHKTVYTGPVSAGANGKPVSAGRANGRAVLSGVGNYNILPLLHPWLHINSIWDQPLLGLWFLLQILQLLKLELVSSWRNFF